MSDFTVELPGELRDEIARWVKSSGESAWVADAVRERLAACAAVEALEARAVRGDRTAYERVLARVPAREPSPGDEL